MRMHVLQHVPFEDLGAIEPWAVAKGFSITRTSFWNDEPLPAPGEIDALVIMGGPMSVHEEGEFPWLVREKAFVRAVIARKCPVLGVCLGAQLIAEALGGAVRKNAIKEIGWFPITLTASAAETPLFSALPESFTAFHWHGETFDLPPGAIHVAASEGCLHQAFVYNQRVAALQFHLECTPPGIERLLEHCADEIRPAPAIQSAETIRAGFDNAKDTVVYLNVVLDSLFG